MSLEAALQRLWYGPAWRSLPLWPLEALYRGIVALRGATFACGLRVPQRVPVPVVVVGNLTVGGTGKTPVAGWLCAALAAQGWRVGVVLRGYGGSHRGRPRVVRADDEAAVVGDEALLHARGAAHVVTIGAARADAAALAARHGATLVICDDGLQHRALARDVEIVVADAVRGFGNGHCLPAGPLREPHARLATVDALVCTRRGPGAADPRLAHPLRLEARLVLGEAVNLRTHERRGLATFAGRPLKALAGIGQPEAFFAALRSAGLDPQVRGLRDHAPATAADLAVEPGGAVLMTEKDAVKCAARAGPDAWYVELSVAVDATAATRLLALIAARIGASPDGDREHG